MKARVQAGPSRRDCPAKSFERSGVPAPPGKRPIASSKITDDYSAKLDIWAREAKAVRMPRIANLPHFGHRRFDSYEEFNAWKRALRDELLRQGGARWTR